MKRDLVPARSITRAILAFQASMPGTEQPVLVKVQPRLDLEEADCFENVGRQIAEHSGSALHGWRVYEMKGVFLEAEFHAVWRNPGGELLCVSELVDGANPFVFIPEPSRIFFERPLGNRHFKLIALSSLDAFIDAVHALHEGQDRLLKDVPFGTEPDISRYPELGILHVRKEEAQARLERDLVKRR